MASPANATQLYLYRTRLDGKGTAERITPAAQAGRHAYSISPDAKWAMNRWSTFDTPPVNDLVSLPDHKLVRTLVSNTELAERVKQFITPGEFFQVKLGRRREPRRLDDQAPQHGAGQAVPAPHVRLRRARRHHGAGLLGLRQPPLVPVHRRCRLHRGERRQPGHARAQGPRLAEGGVRPDRRALQRAAGRCREGHGAHPSRHRSHPRRHLGLERRRLLHAAGDVPLSRCLPGRHERRVRPRPALLRHDLPGALHGAPRLQRRRLQVRQSPSTRPRGSRATCS